MTSTYIAAVDGGANPALPTTLNNRLSETVAVTSIVGEIKMFGGATAPDGWQICDGSEVLIADKPGLFAVIGNSFGGDGVTSFEVPNFCGRSPIGVGTGSGLTARALAAEVGAESHQLTEAELAAHTHTHGANTGNANDGDESAAAGELYPGGASSGRYYEEANSVTGPSGATGSDTAHNNMQPSLAVNFIIYHGVTS